MIEYLVNDTHIIKAKDIYAVLDKCEKKDIPVDVIALDGVILVERLVHTPPSENTIFQKARTKGWM
jgi:hypothetical protein